MSAVLAIAGADAAERTRRFAFLVTIIAALYGAYLYVPDASAHYVTVEIDGYRGIYDSAWIGSMTALLSGGFLALFGFYLIRGCVERDRELNIDAIVAATPVHRLPYLFGKFLSNLSVLAAIALVMFCGDMFMQLLRGEDRHVDLLAYLLPFAIVVLPALAIVGAVALLFDSIRPLRGVLGGLLYFILWGAMLVYPNNNSAGTMGTFLDPTGSALILSQMQSALHRVAPGAKNRETAVGVTGATRPMKTFRFEGMRWTAAIVVRRLAWFGISLLLVLLAVPFFDRFRREEAIRRSGERRRLDIARFIPNAPGLRLYRAELALLLNGANEWWLLGALAIFALTSLLPLGAVIAFALPLAFIWPIERWSALGSRERRWNVLDIVAATPRPITRSLIAQWAGGSTLGIAICAGFIARLLFAGDVSGALACGAVACAIAAVALASGAATGSARLFEAVYLIAWYVGPINHAPPLDFTGAVLTAPLRLLAITAMLAGASILIAFASRQGGRIH